MTAPVQQILERYLLKVHEITFYKRSKRLELSLVSDRFVKPNDRTKIQSDLLANIPAVSDFCLNIKCADADKALFEDIDSAKDILKEYAKELNPQCAPIIDCSIWEINLDSNSIIVRVPERYAKLMHEPIREVFAHQGLTTRFEIVGDEKLDIIKGKVPKKDVVLSAPKPKKVTNDTKIIFGSLIPENTKLTSMSELRKLANELRKEIANSDKAPSVRVTVCGEIIALTEEEEKRKEQNLDKLRRVIADDSSAVQLLSFKLENDKKLANQRIEEAEKADSLLVVRGKLSVNKNSDEFYIMPYDINTKEKKRREDKSEKKRVELHLHTRMSEMDALTKVSDVIKTAARWGHKAVAITDHGVVHAFPEAMDTAKKCGIKLIYGVEGYLQDDCELLYDFGESFVSVDGIKRSLVSVSLVCFNVLNEKHFVEISAVNHATGERFTTLVNSGAPIPARFPIKYDKELLSQAPHTEQAIESFLSFLGDSIVVCHAAQDYFALCSTAKRYGYEMCKNHINTQTLTHYLKQEAVAYDKLSNACDEFGISTDSDNATLTQRLYQRICEALRKNDCTLPLMHGEVQKNKKRRHNYFHIILLAKNREGLKNLYRLVSYSHIENFSHEPLIPRSLFGVMRNGIILGSACERGEVFRCVLEKKSEKEILKTSSWYDYLEIQPIGNNAFMVRNGMVESDEDLRNLNKKIVALGSELNIPVVATGDVHFLEPEDSIYRAIIMHSKHFKDANEQPPLYFKTTCEMLEEFSYLGEEKAMEVVVDNPNGIAESCSPLTAYLDEKTTYSPVFENASEELLFMSKTRAHNLYGDDLPEIVENRLKFELDSIINNGYATLYMSAVKLVKKSNDDGYLVGSRGSVGSSFVAYLADITEVNPLSAHYLCPECKNSEFISKYSCGSDMPNKKCSN
ncbi:MAG: PHP domain-containing protein, partial [Clostridiales bacterium]|nr:PHP domain-containing protein [Clostridiales bacterium]